MHVAASRDSASATKTVTPSRAKISAQIHSARSRGCAIELTSDASRRISSRSRSKASATLAVGIGVRGSLLLCGGALRVEALDVAAFGAGGRVDHRVDQRRLARGERLGQRAGEARRIGAVVALAAEGFDDPLIPRVAQQ